MKNPQGKRALLTGASRGIGTHIAEALAREGVSLVLTARNIEQVQEVAKKLESYPVDIETYASDMIDPSSLLKLYQAATQNGRSIDILVNNAGIYDYSRFEESDFSAAERMIQVNLTGLMYLTKLVLPAMRERNMGHIVNISSLAGLSGSAYAETYCATKHAVVGFTRSLRASLKQDQSKVSASVICPGIVGETGIFKKLEIEENVKAPKLMGESRPQAVSEAVVRSIVRDLPEVIVNPTMVRPGLVLGVLLPGLMESLALKLGLHGFLNPGNKE